MSQAKLVTTLALCLCVLACSEKKQLEEMHDSTEKMEQTTRKMNESTSEMNIKTGRMADTTDRMSETTEELSEKTESLKNITDELYDALRQGNALQLRREAWNSVLSAPTMFKRLSEAAKYFMSYELQLWNLYGQDRTLEKRDVLAQQAAQEFFLEIEDLAPRSGDLALTAMPSPDQPDSEENRAAAFNAYAVSAHLINRKQNTTLKQDSKLEMVSMLTLIEDALMAKKELQLGTKNFGTKDGYIREILAHEEKAIQILQTRYNYFPLMFMDMTTKLSEKNIAGKLKMMVFGWELDLDKMNIKEMEYLQTEVLQQSIRARNFMIKAGIEPKLDYKVSALLKNMKIKTRGEKSPAVVAQQTNLIGMLHELQPRMK
jgi:hypothetical protein